MIGMQKNHNNPEPILTLLQPGTHFSVPLGVAGWIETDVSAVTGVNQAIQWVVSAFSDAFVSKVHGARPTGSTEDTSVDNVIYDRLSRVNAAGHMDLYRNATANSHYLITGQLI